MLSTTNEDLALLRIERRIEVAAPVQTVFEALIEQLGPAGETPDGTPMPMNLEAWPGGRWYRDLGEGGGHFWGTVQAIKAPALLEIWGPLFMSYPVVSNLQYRLTEQGDSTTIDFHHLALGEIDAEHRDGVETGWDAQLKRVKERAEARGGQE